MHNLLTGILQYRGKIPIEQQMTLEGQECKADHVKGTALAGGEG
jgi:hypothetical protein